MTFPTPDRYSELVRGIIDGDFYNSSGVVVPFSNTETVFLLETESASTNFGYYVNELFQGSLLTDSEGNVEFSVLLPLGEVELTFVSSTSGQKIVSYVTVRDYAIWLSSYSENLELVDANLIQARNNLSIKTADSDTLSNFYGEALGIYQDLGQDIEAYRNQIQELRSAFRSQGGTFKGLEAAVASITQVPPFGYSRRKWGPNWVLDQSMLVNHRFLDRSHKVNPVTPVNITGVTPLRAEPDVVGNSVVHTLDYDSTANTLVWSPSGNAGPAVPVVDGELFLPGPPSTEKATVLGGTAYTGPFDIIASPSVFANDKLYIDVDGLGLLTVTLTAGIGVLATTIRDEINAVSSADSRYLANIASVYNSRIAITSQSDGGSVKILHGLDNAALHIFGFRPGCISIPTVEDSVAPGITLSYVDGSTIVLDSGSRFYHTYNAALSTPHAFRWSAGGVIGGTSVLIDSSGTYSITDFAGNILTFVVDYDQLLEVTGTTIYTFSTGYTTSVESADQTQGLWVSVTSASLPGSNQTDTLTVYDDTDDSFVETPDNWFIDTPSVGSTLFAPSKVSTDKVEDLDPTPAFSWRVVAATADTEVNITSHVEKFPLINGTPRGSNYPQKGPGSFYDYEGYTAIFSGWFKSLNAYTPDVSLIFSFDGGDNWTTPSSTVTLIADTGALGYEDAQFVTESVIIPADISISTTNWEDSGVLVRVVLENSSANINVECDSLSVEIKYISSRYLTNATMARTRHSQYFGELVYLWSKTPLTLREQEYLGLAHKSASPMSSFGGVTISAISSDTTAGNGTLTYRYNSTAPMKQLSWAPNGGSSTGLVSVTTDGTYQLAAVGGSYIEVDAVYDNMPVYTGTLPSSKTRTITISDNTIKPGLPRSIFTAHSALEIIDASEYDASGDPVNIHGYLDESDFDTCDYINVEINEGSDTAPDPVKYAYLAPDATPQAGEELTLALVGANYDADLDYYSDEDQESAILYEDGIPVPNDLWSFSGANTISIPEANFPTYLSLASTYTIDYDLLYQVQTEVIDIGANYQNYMWLADYWLWDRMDKVEGEYLTNTPLYFNFATGRAYLDHRSSMEPATTTLYIQQAGGSSEVPPRYWRFLNDKTIELDASFQALGQYYLSHNELRVYPESRLTYTFEHRSATAATGVASETFAEIERNDNIYVTQTSGHRYHQLRLSIAGVRDLTDFRIRSLVMKGLQIHGLSPSVEGLTNIWGL